MASSPGKLEQLVAQLRQLSETLANEDASRVPGLRAKRMRNTIAEAYEQLRKVMEHLGLQVTRLLRVSFGPFQLGKLPKGAIEEVPRRELRGALGAFFTSLKD